MQQKGKTMKRLTIQSLSGLGFALTMLGAPASQAQTAGPLAVEVVDRHTGQILPTYQYRGQLWVEGRPGAAYGVRLTNRSGARVMAVASVDGVNVLTGATASAGQPGYVLNPWQNTQINGWRKNANEVAQFYFTDVPDSYAARTGRPNDVGVIGVAVFHEYQQPYYPQQPWSKSAPSGATESGVPQAGMQKRGSTSAPALGTGHGHREYSQSHQTTFQRASNQPAATLQIRYASRESLQAMGVIPHTWAQRQQYPSAFPADRGFVPDPPRWR